jgi:glycosyltransferase involved in cell wall biosynthesis
MDIVSIVLCTYNGGAFVNEQLLSIRNQTYSNLEIIVCDDCSNDNTIEILKSHQIQDSRIKLHFNEINIGYTKNFSKASELATGKFVAFSDQDDVWHKQKIEILIQKAIQSNCPIVYCDSIRFENKIPEDAKENPRYRRFEGNDPKKISIFNTVSGHAMLVKKDFLKDFLPFDFNLFYDWHLAAFGACNGGVTYVSQTLVYQRIHPNNITIGSGFNHNDKSSKPIFNKMVDTHLKKFCQLDNLSEKDKIFFKRLSFLWSKAVDKKFSIDLFLFLLKNREVIFWYKRKKVAFFSHFKHSLKLASN